MLASALILFGGTGKEEKKMLCYLNNIPRGPFFLSACFQARSKHYTWINKFNQISTCYLC